MREEYFIEQDKKIQEKIDLARLGMYAALEFINFKERNAERAKRNISTIIDKIVNAQDYQEKANKRNLLAKKIKDERQTVTLVPRSKVMDLVERMAESKYRIHWADTESYSSRSMHDDQLMSIASKISGNPADALNEFSSMYTQAVFRREQLKKQREEAAKAELERKKAETERERPQYVREPLVQQRPGYSDYSMPDAIVARALSEEDIQRRVAERLKNGNETLDYELRRNIEQKYKSLDNQQFYGEFYGPGNLPHLYKYYVLSEKALDLSAITNYTDMIKMGTLAVEIVFKDLMNGHQDANTHMARFVSHFDPHGTLERYERARERYLRFYDHLNTAEKTQVDNYAAKFDDYRELFGFQNLSGRAIASVEDIKRVVNYQVKQEYVVEGEYNKHFRENGEFEQTFQGDLEYSVKYMSVNELKDLYNSIKYREMETQRYAIRDGEGAQRVTEIQQKRLAEIQKAFADAIRHRLTNSVMTMEEINDEQAKANFMARRERDLIAIIHDVFQEEPLFDMAYVKVESVQPGYGNARIETAETLSTARRKYFNMSKLEQVLGTLKLNKLEELSRRDILSQSEVVKVKTMF